MTNPRTESPINSRVSNDSVNCSYSLRADLCVKAFWYKSRFLIFVPTSCSALSFVMKETMFINVCVYFLSLLLHVVRGEELLDVQVGNLNVSRGLEKRTKLVVENNLATVVGVLEAVVSDVLGDKLGHLRTRDELTSGKSKELTQLRCHILLTVEPVVGGTSLRLLTVRIILGTLNLADKLGEVLHVSAEGGKLGLNSFKRHYIFLTCLIFKSLKKYIVATVTISHNKNIETRLSNVK